MNDLRPTTKNNSSVLKDLDVEIQYSVNPSVVPELAVKYVNMHMDNPAGFLPAYQLVEKQAKSVVADAVSQFDVLSIASKRNELEGIIMKNLQSDLDKNDPNTFTVSRVTISNLLLDDRIQSSIQQIAESENQKQVALNKLEIAKTKPLKIKCVHNHLTVKSWLKNNWMHWYKWVSVVISLLSLWISKVI